MTVVGKSIVLLPTLTRALPQPIPYDVGRPTMAGVIAVAIVCVLAVRSGLDPRIAQLSLAVIAVSLALLLTPEQAALRAPRARLTVADLADVFWGGRDTKSPQGQHVYRDLGRHKHVCDDIYARCRPHAPANLDADTPHRGGPMPRFDYVDAVGLALLRL